MSRDRQTPNRKLNVETISMSESGTIEVLQATPTDISLTMERVVQGAVEKVSQQITNKHSLHLDTRIYR